MDPVEFEVNEMSFIGSSAALGRYADQQRVRNNQNREQGNGLIENLRRYVGENMLNLNGNQDEDGQERGNPPNIGLRQGIIEPRLNRNGESMWWDQERLSEDRSSTSPEYQPVPVPRLQPVAEFSQWLYRKH